MFYKHMQLIQGENLCTAVNPLYWQKIVIIPAMEHSSFWFIPNVTRCCYCLLLIFCSQGVLYNPFLLLFNRLHFLRYCSWGDCKYAYIAYELFRKAVTATNGMLAWSVSELVRLSPWPMISFHLLIIFLSVKFAIIRLVSL